MKRGSTFFLKGVIFLIGIAGLALCIFLVPELARRDAQAHPETAYLQYPFLLCAYLLATPFFIALYHAFKLVSYIEKNMVFSELSVKSLKMIKRCAITLSSFMVAGVISVVILSAGKGEDITGVISLGFMITFASSVIATFSSVLQRLVKEIADIISENELIV